MLIALLLSIASLAQNLQYNLFNLQGLISEPLILPEGIPEVGKVLISPSEFKKSSDE